MDFLRNLERMKQMIGSVEGWMKKPWLKKLGREWRPPDSEKKPHVLKRLEQNWRHQRQKWAGKRPKDARTPSQELKTTPGLSESFQELEHSILRYIQTHANDHLVQAHKGWMRHHGAYFSENAVDAHFESHRDDARLIAFYLPQYHPVPENDEWWGAGFTEWTNVSRTKPRFVGHLQPLLPSELGFYDLRLEESMKQQIDLAKQHGIGAFCFYHYWFSGRRLLERPVDQFIANKSLDFPFCLCWANENWTRRWDGKEEDILLGQEHLQDDPKSFIENMEPYLRDSRYLRVANKPVLLVYRADLVNDCARWTDFWRTWWRDKHEEELYLIAVLGFAHVDPRPLGFDAGMDFPPHLLHESYPVTLEQISRTPHVHRLDATFRGQVFDYRQLVKNSKKASTAPFPIFRTIMPSWDNEARRKGSGNTFCHTSPDLYAQWLDNRLTTLADDSPHPLVFVNAWNEWAEGTILEPDSEYGRAHLIRTAEVLAKHSKNPSNLEKFPPFQISRSGEIAVILHLYYQDLWPWFEEKLKVLQDIPHQLFVSTCHPNADLENAIAAFDPRAKIIIVPNQGRDVLPFLHLARRARAAGYEFVLKLHSKKSYHLKDGEGWREQLVKPLLKSVDHVRAVVRYFKENPDVGLMSAHGQAAPFEKYFGNNEERVTNLLHLLGHDPARIRDSAAKDLFFLVGSMFWCRLEALMPLLELHLMPIDFEGESGQLDSTVAHAVERLFTLQTVFSGYRCATTDGTTMAICEGADDALHRLHDLSLSKSKL